MSDWGCFVSGLVAGMIVMLSNAIFMWGVLGSPWQDD